MAITIFYSWQSDLPNRLNRSFIEKALEKAIKKLGEDIEIQEALRDEGMELDKDTKGVPGTPPIVDTIFDKISNCSVFVPDLTFVGKSVSSRLIPNPNVLIEYGWAIKELSYSRIIAVMNSAFGEPTAENMPFDMRHLRNPITYHLDQTADEKERAKIKEKLANDLYGALRIIVETGILNQSNENQEEFDGVPYTSDPSTFLHPDETFVDPSNPGSEGLKISDAEHLFLRIIPKIPLDNLKTSKSVIDLAIKGNLFPMSEGGISWSFERNKYGAYVFFQKDGKIVNFTQLFKSGELWGIDAFAIDKSRLMKAANVKFGFFPCGYLEKIFVITLSHYLKFSKEIIGLPVPLKFIAGATDVLGYNMYIPQTVGLDFGGPVVEDHIVYEGIIEDYSIDPHIILRPFFEYVWEECGLERPDKYKLYK